MDRDTPQSEHRLTGERRDIPAWKSRRRSEEAGSHHPHHEHTSPTKPAATIPPKQKAAPDDIPDARDFLDAIFASVPVDPGKTRYLIVAVFSDPFINGSRYDHHTKFEKAFVWPEQAPRLWNTFHSTHRVPTCTSART